MENKKFRAQRARQLIQIGGLFEKAGLPALLGIPPTMDMQTDGAQAAELSSIVLGIFLEQLARLESDGPARDLLISGWRMAGKARFREDKERDL